VERGEGEGSELAELLDQELGYDATTGTRLSNHLPMALVALHRLGATDGRLTEFAARYRSRLVPVPDVSPVQSHSEWLAARGRHGAYGQLRAYFERAVGDLGPDEALRRHLGHLVDGLSGAAFHGLIRLAYSIECGSDRRVAAGLAYLSEVYQPLGARGTSAPWTDEPILALGRLSNVEVLRRLSRGGNIGQQMRQVAAHPSFAGVVDWLEITDETPERLTSAAITLFAATDDFTALHAVTASHAVAVVSPFVDDLDSLCAWWFQGVAAAFVTIGAPRVSNATRGLEGWLVDPVPWEHIEREAVASDDEHVVKLAYSARELFASSKEPLLQAAAARHTGIPAPS